MTAFKASFWVAYGDETRAKGSPASSFIPTIGYPTTAIDLYRTVGVSQSDAADAGLAFLDIEAAASLSKLAEGGITSYRDLELAEQALQAILLREVPKILVPGLKCESGGHYINRRFDQGLRTDFCFELLKPFGTTDYLFSAERVNLDDEGRIIGSTLLKSGLVGRKISDVSFGDLSNSLSGRSVRFAASDLYGVPVYSSLKDYTDPRRTGAFAKILYNKIQTSWKSATDAVPPVSFDFDVPPLLAIVLNRIVGSREELASVLVDLREELQEPREELLAFEHEVANYPASQGNLVAQTRRIEEAFSAIVPEAMLTPAQRRKRRIVSIFNLAKPIYNFAAAFVGANSVDLSALGRSAGDIGSQMVAKHRITDRTVSSQVFSKILDVEAVQQSLPSVLSEAEIREIERSLR